MYPKQYYAPAGVAVPPPPTGAPYAFQTQQGPQLWSTGLFDCTGDCSSCCMTCFCPCVTFGQIAEFVDQGATSCGSSGALYVLLNIICCQWIYSCIYRSKMRTQFRLVERPCKDCFVHCCCGACALWQEYRELKNRGFDMTIGWHANMAKWAQGMTVPPVMQMGMMR